MLVPHTPRSSFDHPCPQPRAHPTGLLDLPTEIRVDIYKLLFANIACRPYRIEYRASTGWQVRTSRNFTGRPIQRSAVLLQVNRQIYEEALDVLHKISGGGPTISLTSISRPDWQGVPREDFDKRVRVFRLTGARKQLPAVLKGVHQTLTIQVNVPTDLVDQAIMIAFVRWMRAVFNTSRASGEGLQLEVLRIVYRGLQPLPGMGMYDAFCDWRCERAYASFTGGCLGEQHILPPLLAMESRDEDEKMAWKACEAIRAVDVAHHSEPSFWQTLFRRNYVFTVLGGRGRSAFW